MSSLCQLDLTEAFDTGDHELLLRRTLHECISLLTYLHTSRPPANTGFDKRDGSDVCVVYCRDCTQTDTKSIRITVNTVSRTVYRKIVGHLGSYVMASAETFWLLLLYRYEKRILASLRR